MGDNCRMADKIKISPVFLLKKWEIVVVGDKKTKMGEKKRRIIVFIPHPPLCSKLERKEKFAV